MSYELIVTKLSITSAPQS